MELNHVDQKHIAKFYNKKHHLSTVIQLLNTVYPEGVTDDLLRFPQETRDYIRAVVNAEGEFCTRPDLIDGDDDYYAPKDRSQEEQDQIVQDYIDGMKMENLILKYEWPNSRIRTLLKNRGVYIRNRYMFVLEPLVEGLESQVFDRVQLLCKFLGVSPHFVDQIYETKFKGYYVRKIDLVKINLKKSYKKVSM